MNSQQQSQDTYGGIPQAVMAACQPANVKCAPTIRSIVEDMSTRAVEIEGALRKVVADLEIRVLQLEGCPPPGESAEQPCDMPSGRLEAIIRSHARISGLIGDLEGLVNKI